MRDKETYVTTRADSTGLTNYMNQTGRFELLNAEQEVDLARQIEAGIYASHLLEVDEDRQEYDVEYRQALGTIALEGCLARQQLINANTRLAVNKATRYKRAMVHNKFDDLINNANLGLIDATSTFDYKRGVRFSTYAGILIDQSLYLESNRSESTVRVPKDYLRKYVAINKIRDDYELIHGHKPSNEHVAQQLKDTTADEIYRADKYMRAIQTTSIYQPVSSGGDEEDRTLLDIIKNKPAQSDEKLFETEYEQQTTFKKINQLIDGYLAPREAMIIRLHYGFLGEEPMNFQEIGDELDLSRERIRVLHKKSLQTLLELPEMAELKILFEA
jgi:RNA polymerase primary sigma factor